MTDTPPWRLDGRMVVVTGSAGGLGASVADTVEALGGVAVRLDVDGAGCLPCDVTSVIDWEGVVSGLQATHGHVDGLVTCAGTTWRARASELGADDLRRVLDVNVVGTHQAVQSLLPLMDAGSSIVMIGSLAGRTGHYPTAYTASKWAVRGLAHSTALDLGPRGIRVNVVHPGFVETPMTLSAPAAFRESSLKATTLGRVAEPPDVAQVVCFLLGEGSRHVHGAEIDVDGGAASQAGAKPVADALPTSVPND